MGIFDTAKAAANILKEAGKIDEYRTILELLDDLLDKRNEIQKLNEEILALKKKLEIKNDYTFKNEAYWHQSTDDGPFCPRCYDLDYKVIRIFKPDPENIYAECPVCEKRFNVTGRNSTQEGLQAMKNYTDSLDPY